MTRFQRGSYYAVRTGACFRFAPEKFPAPPRSAPQSAHQAMPPQFVQQGVRDDDNFTQTAILFFTAQALNFVGDGVQNPVPHDEFVGPWCVWEDSGALGAGGHFNESFLGLNNGKSKKYARKKGSNDERKELL